MRAFISFRLPLVKQKEGKHEKRSKGSGKGRALLLDLHFGLILTNRRW